MTPHNRGHHRAKWSLLILVVSFLFLQSCQQDQPPTASPTLPVPTITPFLNQTAVSAATPLPFPLTASPSPVTTSIPTPTPTVIPAQPSGQMTIGQSVQNQPVVAYWAGTGPKKVAIVGGGAATMDLAAPYLADPQRVPPDLTLWFIPDPNPDNARTDPLLNANGVNVFQNADTRFVQCPNRLPADPVNGPFPFSEPESQSLGTFLVDFWISLFLTADFESFQPGGCGWHQPSNALASFYAPNSGPPVSQTDTVTHHLIDYLVGQGTAAAIINPNALNSDSLSAMLPNVEAIMAAETTPIGANLEWLDETEDGLWQFPTATFAHPIALEQIGDQLFILDSGRVQIIDRQNPAMPTILLAPDDEVAGVRVIEPLDLAAVGQTLLVLDRAGDVYAYDTGGNAWSLVRYDRPAGDTSSHYYLALTAQTGSDYQFSLLEGSYHLAVNQQTDQPDYIWPLPENHQIDISIYNNDVYILSQSPISQTAVLAHYQNGVRDNDFAPHSRLIRSRQIQALGSLIYTLDYNGRRLSTVNAATGELIATYLPADGQPFSAFNVNETTGSILLAGRDKLLFVNQPNMTAVIPGTGQLPSPQIHDPQVLDNLRGLLMPIGGSDIAIRENQMPGAPRHYRLGVHEGADFYWGAGTAVRAVAPGTVIRATVNYVIPSEQLFNSWRTTVQNLGYTSPEAHDFYRGMQVWIEHEGGLISRYVHLSAIDDMIQEGVTVQAGQIIGAVGNTGSPVSLEGPDTDAHLHFELWLNNQYLGQFLRPIETREWLKIILNEK